MLVTHPLLSEFDWPNVPPGITTVYGTGKPGQPGSIVPLPGLRLSREDPHPNAAGHKVIARNLFEELEGSGILTELMGR